MWLWCSASHIKRLGIIGGIKILNKNVQTVGRNILGEFAPEFAHFNDEVLFGEN